MEVTAGKLAKWPEVQHETDETARRLTDLGEQLDILESRLAPVTQTKDVPPDAEKDSSGLVDLANCIWHHNHQITDYADRVRSIIERLEI